MPFRFKIFKIKKVLPVLMSLGWCMEGSRADEEGLPMWLRKGLQAAQPSALPWRNQDFQGALSPVSESTRTVLYLSFSMGPQRILETLTKVTKLSLPNSELLIVFRGLPQGDTLRTFSQRVEHLIKGYPLSKRPSITLDPVRFQQHAIDQVPVLMVEKGRNILQKETRRFSPQVSISEEDLLQRIRSRMGAFDWDKARKTAAQDVINHIPMLDLPEVSHAASRRLRLTMRVPEDLHTPDGKLLASKGALINPMTLPMPPLHLWVFNPLVPAQVRATERVLAAHVGPSLTLIATRLDRDLGLSGLLALESTLKHPVTLLTPELKERLTLTHVPVEITVDGEDLLIIDVPPEEASS